MLMLVTSIINLFGSHNPSLSPSKALDYSLRPKRPPAKLICECQSKLLSRWIVTKDFLQSNNITYIDIVLWFLWQMKSHLVVISWITERYLQNDFWDKKSTSQKEGLSKEVSVATCINCPVFVVWVRWKKWSQCSCLVAYWFPRWSIR